MTGPLSLLQERLHTLQSERIAGLGRDFFFLYIDARVPDALEAHAPGKPLQQVQKPDHVVRHKDPRVEDERRHQPPQPRLVESWVVTLVFTLIGFASLSFLILFALSSVVL